MQRLERLVEAQRRWTWWTPDGTVSQLVPSTRVGETPGGKGPGHHERRARRRGGSQCGTPAGLLHWVIPSLIRHRCPQAHIHTRRYLHLSSAQSGPNSQKDNAVCAVVSDRRRIATDHGRRCSISAPRAIKQPSSASSALHPAAPHHQPHRAPSGWARPSCRFQCYQAPCRRCSG